MSTVERGGRKFDVGVLKPKTVQVYPSPGGAYYSLLKGENPDGETRFVMTRGAGRQGGATRVPIWLPPETAQRFAAQQSPLSSYEEVLRFLAGENLHELRVLLVQMPREGNLLSGLEWNAPGGTAEPEELPEEIARREFDEECNLSPLWAGGDFPDWTQFSSGVYDEVQYLSLALVTGSPNRLVEGARSWSSTNLAFFKRWAGNQNQLEDYTQWVAGDFCPVDGKVYFVVRCLVAEIIHQKYR